MRKFIYALVMISFAVSLNAQWEPDVRLTNDPANSYTPPSNKWGIASNGNFINIVWQESRDGNSEIYYKRSTNGGTTWGTDTRLTNNAANSHNPSVAISGLQVHVVWYDDRDTNNEIYYKRSTDGGTTWGADTRLTDNGYESRHANLSVSGSQINVVWQDARDENWEIYYKRSTDGGTTWGEDIRLTNSSEYSQFPSIAVSGSNVHLVWNDYRDGNDEIYYKRSTDGGTTWGADTRLTNNTSFSYNPSVAVSGSQVYVVWQDFRNSKFMIFYKRSTDGGATWGTDTQFSNNPYTAREPSIAVSGSLAYAVWEDDRESSKEIFYKSSTDAGTNWTADTRLTNNTGFSGYAFVSISGSLAHVAWTDNRDGNNEIYYKRTLPPIPAIPTLVSPLNNSTNQLLNLNLVWNKTQYSTKYRVLLATDSLFNTVIINDSLLTDSIKSLTSLNPLTNYYWKVNAGNVAGWSSYSTVYKFTTIPPLPLAPTLISPPNNATNQVPNVLLDWNSVQYAVSYKVQIANDSMFTSMVFDTSNVNRDSLRVRLGLLIVNTKYYWRVNATNITGTGQWSTVWNFRISPVGLISLNSELPTEYKLYNNYPNPFNPTTKIKFDVANGFPIKTFGNDKVVLKVYDVMGREVQTLVNESLKPGTYEATFDGSNLNSGVYFYKMITNGFTETKKMLMIK